MRIIKSSINKRTSATSFPYKGYRIKLLNDGTGWAVYENQDLVDYGFRTSEDAKSYIDSNNEHSSINATDDLSMYSDEFRHAYTLAKNDFKKDYKRAHADVQIYPSDPYLGVEEGEIVLHVTGFNPYGKKCGGMVSVDESLDSDILYQAMKETAEDLGIRKGSYDIKNSTFIQSSTDDELFIEDIIDGLEDNGYDLNDLSSIKEGLWALFGYQGKDAHDVIEDLVAGGFLDSNVLINKGYHSVYSATEDDEEDLPMVDQEYDSAATSINSNKLPAIYRMVNFNPGDVIVDFGGGKFDNAVEYIKDKGATLCVYDPYNRSAEHNREVLRILRENGGADAAVNSNVLNVIKEPEARKNVLENISRITKPGAPIYITVYEGKGNGQEGPTKSGYQLNRKTADYLEEIQEVFPDATRRGKLITAHNNRSVNSSMSINADEDVKKRTCRIDSYGAFDNGYVLHNDWKKMSNEEAEHLAKQYSENDPDDVYYVHYDNVMDPSSDYVWYQGEPYMSGDVVYRGDSIDVRSTPVSENEVFGLTKRDSAVEGASNEVELDPEDSIIDLDVDEYILVNQGGDWEYDSDDYNWASSDGEGSDWYSETGVRLDDPTGVVEKIDELIEPYVPIEPGTYRVQGYIELYYTVSGVYENRYDYTEDDYSSDINSDFGSAEYNKKLSKIENIKVTKI